MAFSLSEVSFVANSDGGHLRPSPPPLCSFQLPAHAFLNTIHSISTSQWLKDNKKANYITL